MSPVCNSLGSLHTIIQQATIDTIDEWESDAVIRAAGYRHIVVLETRRDLSVQMAYYSRSRMSVPDVQAMFRAAGLWAITAADAKVASTWTLESKHLDGKAFDAMPSKDGVNPDWSAPAEVLDRMAEIAERHGLRPGRRWKNPDSPHYEV